MEQFEKTILSKPTWALGALQTLGVIAYVVIFVTTVFNLQPHVPIDSPIIGAITFLTAFVASALICGSLVLGLPVLLALRGHIKQAVQLVAWSSAWFAAILIAWVIILAAIS